MAPRANWKGYLRLSLVSCPIALYPASSLSEKVSFNRLNRKTGNRLKQQNVDSETGEVVPREDTARGYEVAKGPGCVERGSVSAPLLVRRRFRDHGAPI
jgi:non-homologous end joining protein Ku